MITKYSNNKRTRSRTLLDKTPIINAYLDPSMPQIDITQPAAVDIQLSEDQRTLHVNVNGICVLRICRMLELELNGLQTDAEARIIGKEMYELGVNDQRSRSQTRPEANMQKMISKDDPNELTYGEILFNAKLAAMYGYPEEMEPPGEVVITWALGGWGWQYTYGRRHPRAFVYVDTDGVVTNP